MEQALLAWYGEHARDLPWRRTRDPYAILVSEVMLQQTQVARVVPRYEAWLARWPTVEALADASAADVIRAWQGLGYNRRALNLHRAARQVAANGWPEDLTELPGVGRYTADAVARFALRPRRAPGRHERSSRARPNRRAVRARTRPTRSWISARRSATRALPAVRRARSPSAAPPAARYAPLRKQSRFEGSFRQRRAQTLRLVTEGRRQVAQLDGEAVEALRKDGFLVLEGDRVELAN